MFRKQKVLFTIGFLALFGSFYMSGCKKSKKIAKQGEKCGGNTTCAKGTKCHFGFCEDLSMNSTECKYLKAASQAVMMSSPKALLKGINHKPDQDLLTGITSGGATLYKAFGHPLSRKQCKRMLDCELPKLGVGYAWFWTKAAYKATGKMPPGAVKVPKNPISIISVDMKQNSMGEDPSIFPPEKIKMMQEHRIGCMSKVKFRVTQKFAGFVTFHYWKKDNCVFEPAKKGVKDSKPGWKCNGEKVLNKPYYTQTVYLYPFSDSELAKKKKALKGKSKRGFLTGNPGTYMLDVWAYNPIDEKTFGMHRQFEGKQLEELKAAEDFKFCPKYGDDPFNNGCACIGFVPSKITVTTHPDPFFFPMNEEKCTTTEEAPKKK